MIIDLFLRINDEEIYLYLTKSKIKTVSWSYKDG